MSIQLIDLGTAPKGVDGDTQRTANQKMNANVQYLDGLLQTTKSTAASALSQAEDIAGNAFTKTGGEIRGETKITYAGTRTGITLNAVLPDCVRAGGHATDANGNDIEDALALDYNAMTAVNTQLIKEQDAIIRSLLARVAALEKAMGAPSL